MRLLHTSDWHLGQTLHTYDRSYEHGCFLDWLVETLARERIDVLLIAGDIFDNANPSAAAHRQLYRFLQRAKARVPHLQVVVIAGNHDSPGRLEAPTPLLEAHGTVVVGNVGRTPEGAIDLERLLVPLRGRDGQVAAWCLAVPFLRPGDLPRAPAQQDPGAAADDDAPDPYLHGSALLYRQAYALARARCGADQAIIAMGHCHMVDGQSSQDSERRIVIGGTEALPASMFDPDLAYVALGHLHLAQRVGGHERRRYCGSPLPLSFSEVGYQHQVLCIELEGRQATSVTPLPVPRAVQLLRVPARPAPLEEVLAALEALELPDAAPPQQPFLEVRVLLDGPEPGLRSRLEAALEGKPVRLAKIEPTRRHAAPDSAGEALSLDQLAQLQPDDIFRRLWTQRYGGEAPPEQLAAFAELTLSLGGDAA
ncbi:exonuclease SbcCD subunit D C-terminal domain-containing protein [Massilia sp. MS-15]|uniref:exonuclease SbcCD subunit D C-terminal domain-containing protein n=1 Tax=Massilia sp. MS-15 TaxID=2878200 RepID=UPI001CD61704|nr:exonuclease SbcCD subunit D C-terminal domain-containing protein [Massilia sp. MS-15]MCA1248743.1 exonuclease SbcCD subunit D C-terminal domain-containing protein [Massilia sp. MS-15]